MLIFILGYMGAGKTTLGQQLAQRLNYHFYDLDEMIEISTGYTIGGYFEKFGEGSFRQKEREILLDHMEDKQTVISVGGGTPCYADNMALMNKNGITVYIDTGIETIMSRLAGKIHERPLLKHIPPGQLLLFISEHLRIRQEFYLQAAFTINGDSIDLDNLVNAVRSLAGRKG